MKNKIIPIALLFAFPLIGCSTSQVKAVNRANEGTGTNSNQDGDSSTGSEVVTPTESEHVTLFKRLTAESYFTYEEKENTEEGATFTYTTTFNITSELGEAKSFVLNYKEVVKEEADVTDEDETKPHHPHHENRKDEVMLEGELVIGETSYTVEGFLENEHEEKEYRFHFEKEEGVKAGLFFELEDNSVSFRYSEGSRYNLTSEYTYELVKEENFTSVFVTELLENKEVVHYLSQFKEDETSYLYRFSYVDEVVSEVFGTLLTTDGVTTFEEITFDDDFDDKEDDKEGDGCCCDCPCCGNHNKDHEDFDDFDDFEDFDDDWFDDDFDDFNDDFEDYHEGGHGKEDNHHGYNHR